MKSELYDRWIEQLEKRRKKKAGFGPLGKPAAAVAEKTYVHVDSAVSDDEFARLRPLLLDAEAVSRHTFYPFLKVIKKRKRYRKDESGVRRAHPDGPKEREICYAAHHDALYYSWYGFQLETLLEPKLHALGLDDCVLAYRAKGLNNIHFAKDVFDYIAQQPTCVALAFDVTKFFDTLHHGRLRRAWAELLQVAELPNDHYTVFKSMTQFRYLLAADIEAQLGEVEFTKRVRRRRLAYPAEFRQDLQKLQRTNGIVAGKNARKKIGIPQGAPMSAVLSNVYMLHVDARLHHYAQQCGGVYRRYCDDLLLVLPVEHAAEAERTVRAELTGLDLVMNDKKTERRFFTRDASGVLHCQDEHGQVKALQYLGLEYNGKAVLLRSSSLSRYHQRMRRGVRKSVRKALGTEGKKGGKVFRRKLFERFTKLGKSNFIRYAARAYDITHSEAIRKQVSGCVERVNKVIRQEVKRYREKYPTRSSGTGLGGTGHARPVTY